MKMDNLRARLDRLEKRATPRDTGPSAWDVLAGTASPDELAGAQAALWAEWMVMCGGAPHARENAPCPVAAKLARFGNPTSAPSQTGGAPAEGPP